MVGHSINMSFVDKYPALSKVLNHDFSDQALLKLALTHRSKGAKNYERLEFLGDSILGFVVADWLYKNFSELAEGKLSRMRSSLVRKETLALVARKLELSSYLILGEGELKSGGFNRDSILADTVESIIGALYLDSGFSAASKFIYTNFAEHFNSISDVSTFKDAKSRLQEAMQKNALLLPVYNIIETQGEQHDQEFTVECLAGDINVRAVAVAKSRRLAEQEAASIVLEQFKSQSKFAKYKR